MSTLYPGGIDSFDTRVDGVTDVMASDVNDLQDAMVAVQTESQLKTLFRVKNTSGATVVANDCGYIDEKGDFKTTTTANLAATWAVVVTGGANNSQIMVCTRGRLFVNYRVAGGVPSINHFLVTSTTAGEANKQETMRPEIFAVCLANGSGGTVEVLLLTGSIGTNIADPDYMYVNIGSGNYLNPFAAVIDDNAGAHGGQGLDATHVPFDGASGNVDTLPAAPNTFLTRVRLYNEDTGTYREIEDVAANDVIVTESSTDSWDNDDVIVCVSQTIGAGAAIKHYDLKFRDTTTVPLLTRAVAVQVQMRDSNIVNSYDTLHPIEVYGGPKLLTVVPQVNSVYIIAHGALLDLVDGTIGWSQRASGAGTNQVYLSIKRYILAVS